ncbi:MAG: amidohydrolase [Dehalococcoidia bacterium]|nr:amidohydrolase [Dehalococcoidia bacterium]
MVKSDTGLVLRNAGAITLDPHLPQARTIYIQGARIFGVSGKDIDPDLAGAARVVDCRGRTVTPAFHDAHCHVTAYAESLLNIDLSPASVKSIEDIVSNIKSVAATLPAGGWIRCTGYNEFYLAEKRQPTRHDLDRATVDHPVKLTHRSGHAHVLNSAGLKLAGITRYSEEPPGGMIERDLETGDPNGVLFGMGPYLAGVIPPVGAAELEAALARAGETLLSLGITTVQDASPGNGPQRWNSYLDWKKRGIFPLRTILMYGMDEAGRLPAALPPNEYEAWLFTGAVKIMLDEVRGILNPPQEELNRLVLEIQESGRQAAIHAVEETTVEAAITALEQAAKRHTRKDSRHRLEHCSICTPAAARRLQRLGAAVATNPAFIYYSGERYLSTVPKAQLSRLYAIKDMLRAGLRVAAGSDAPISGPDPLKGIYAAVTRCAENGRRVAPSQAITVLEALDLYTDGAACSCFMERAMGSLTKGKLADLVMLGGDLLGADADELKNIRVEMTLMGGKIVYSKGA